MPERWIQFSGHRILYDICEACEDENFRKLEASKKPDKRRKEE
jgi:hypothetical protein